MNEQADNAEATRKIGKAMFWIIVILPALYLWSFGPVLALAERSGNLRLRDQVGVFYEPVGWLHDYTFLKMPLEKYYYFCGGGKGGK